MRNGTRITLIAAGVVLAASISLPAAAEIIRLRVDGTLTNTSTRTAPCRSTRRWAAYSLFYSFVPLWLFANETLAVSQCDARI